MDVFNGSSLEKVNKLSKNVTFCEVRLFLLMLCCAVLSQVWLFVTSRTVACQASLSMGILQARILEWVAMPSSRGSSQPRDWTQVSWIAGGFFTIWATRKAQEYWRAGRFFTSWADGTHTGLLFLVYFPNSVVPKMAAQKSYAVYVNRDIRPPSLTIHNLNLKHIFLQEYFQTHESSSVGLKMELQILQAYIHTHTHIYTCTHIFYT